MTLYHQWCVFTSNDVIPLVVCLYLMLILSDDIIPLVAELGENVDITCLNSDNESNVDIEIMNIATERQKRRSLNTIRIESIGKSFNFISMSNVLI